MCESWCVLVCVCVGGGHQHCCHLFGGGGRGRKNIWRLRDNKKFGDSNENVTDPHPHLIINDLSLKLANCGHLQ